MKSNKGCFITENELKTIDTHEISKIILKNGTILEMTPIKKSTKICTCHKHNNVSKSPLRNTIQYKEPQKFLSLNNNINQKQSLRDTLAYYRAKKLLTIKLPNKKEEQNNIKHNIETFTFESSPKKYIYKPYKIPKRKYGSRNKYNSNHSKEIIPFDNNINNNYIKIKFIKMGEICNNCRKYCTCKKYNIE